jgi:hypothetical protein
MMPLGRWIMGQTTNFIVRVTPRGRSNEQFGWEICRTDDSFVVERSTSVFETQTQALLASAKAASCLAFPPNVSFRCDLGASEVGRIASGASGAGMGRCAMPAALDPVLLHGASYRRPRIGR